MRSRKSAAAPRMSPCARADTRRRCWAGGGPTTRTALRPSSTAAPAAVPPLRPHRGRPWRDRPRRSACRCRPARSRRRRGTPLDAQAPGRLGARAGRPDLLPRNDPCRPAPLGPELEEGQEAARPRRPDPARRQAFVEKLQHVLAEAQRDRHLLVYLDEAHLHQDADLGYGWSERGWRLWVASSSPGLTAKVSFYGLYLYLYNEGEVRLWPFPRANGAHTIEVLRRLRAEHPEQALIVLWDGASYHRAGAVREAAATLRIALMPLPGYSPDLMPV